MARRAPNKDHSRRKGVVEEGVPDDAWRRVHPITPVLNSWQAIAVLLAVVLFQNLEILSSLHTLAQDHGAGRIVLAIIGGILGTLLVISLFSYLAWRAMSFAVTPQAVWLRQGIVFRQQRHVRLERIQAVDVTHPLLGRLFGLGKLSVDAAGGSGSSLSIGYLRDQDLSDLRAHILALAAGLDVGTGTFGPIDQVPNEGVTGIGNPDDSGAAAPFAQDLTGLSDGGPGGDDGQAGHSGIARSYASADARVPERGASYPDVFGQPGLPGPDYQDRGVEDDRHAEGASAVYAPGGHEGEGASPGSGSDAARAQTALNRPALNRISLEAPEDILYSVETGRLLTSLLLSGGIIAVALGFLVSLAAIVVMVIVWGSAGLSVASSWIPAGLVAVSLIWGRFSKEFNFQAAVSPDGIRVRRGLLERRSETIPPRRIHAVRVSQPLLWRRRDWYRVEISQAVHRRDGSGQSSASHALLPVGTREEAMKALWLVLPDLGVDDAEQFFRSALLGTAPSPDFVGIPRSAWIFDPLVKHRRGIALTGTCVVVRDGRVTRTASFAPYERIQSVKGFSGPWAWHRGLQGVRACMVPGPVRVEIPHLSFEDGESIRALIVERSRESRVTEPPERWFARVHAAETELVADDGEGAGQVTGPADPDLRFAPDFHPEPGRHTP